jgi:HSP20-like domain found in ArsA
MEDLVGGKGGDVDRRHSAVWSVGISSNHTAELPGFEEKDIDVQLNNGELTIKAEKEQRATAVRSIAASSAA